MPEESPLPVTERTRHRRLREQGSTDRADLAAILAAGMICHLGVVVDGYPMVVPTVYGLDGDTLYLHGSLASRSSQGGTAPSAVAAARSRRCARPARLHRARSSAAHPHTRKQLRNSAAVLVVVPPEGAPHQIFFSADLHLE